MIHKTDEEKIKTLYSTKIEREKREGITVCNEWKGQNGFENFREWCLTNGYKQGLQIDRKNTLLGYSPDNCRFVTLKENCRNRVDTVFVRHNGEVRKLIELAEEYGIRYSVVYGRLRLGWDLERALSTPEKPKIRRKGGPRFGNRKNREPLPIAISYEEAIDEVINKY